ncbi:uncharacterized protein [Littorina saxatilis]|uniref:uncharacterized protein isoform X1 n=1 Tax=Littorina saxatilis TaxID=31220 RepID=UPI0038B4DADF
MLPPVTLDVGFALRQVLRVHPSVFSARLTLCAGCRRQISTLQYRKPQQKSMYLALSLALPSQTCRFVASTSRSLWRTSIVALATDPPLKSSQTVKSASAMASTASSGSGSEGSGGKGEAASGAGSEEGKPEEGEGKPPKLLQLRPKPRKVKSIDYTYTGNIYILPVRAMNEYLLKPSDLEGLPRYQRRSPYGSGPKITVFLRSDVEAMFPPSLDFL